MNPKNIRESLASYFDSVRISKEGVVTAKRNYFYRNGATAEGVAQTIKKVIPTAVIIETRDHWNAWPRDSFFKVEFKIQEAI